MIAQRHRLAVLRRQRGAVATGPAVASGRVFAGLTGGGDRGPTGRCNVLLLTL